MANNVKQFHITTKGVPAECKAQPGKCPRGGEHFPTLQEANEYASKQLEEQYGCIPNATPVGNTNEKQLSAEQLKDKMSELKKGINSLEAKIVEHNSMMYSYREANREYRTIPEYKVMQKQQSKNANERKEMEREYRSLEKEYARVTLEPKYKEKFDEVLLIKKGKYKGKAMTLYASRNIYRTSGSGRYSQTIKDTETQKVLDNLAKLKMEVTYGNDAPRGGKLGEYYTINEKSKMWKQYKKYHTIMAEY